MIVRLPSSWLGDPMRSFSFGWAVMAAAACGGPAASTSSPSGTTNAESSVAPAAGSSTSASGAIPPALVTLVVSLDVENPRLVDAAREVVQSGNAEAIRLAGDQLVKVARRVGRPEWRAEKRSELESSMRQRGSVTSPAELDLLVLDNQVETLRPLFDAMNVVGGPSIVAFAFGDAGDATLPLERRRLAAGVAAKHVPPNDARAAQAASLQRELDAKSQATVLGSLDDAPRVTRELAPAFKRCFVEYMKTAPPGAGFKGTLEVTLAADGSVASAKLREAPPPKLATCIEDEAKKARFDPPKSGKATIKIPLRFEQAG